jgi:transposase
LTDAQWQVIEKLIPNQGKRKVCLRMVINGIRWLKHTGRQWREMRSDFPCWQTVSYYFNRWGKNGTLTLIMNQLVKAGRIQKNRNELASRAAVDSPSVRKGR